MNQEIHFLGIDAGTGRPFHDPCSRDDLAQLAAHLPQAGRLVRYGIQAEKLESAGWGMVLPRGLDPEIERALEPLTELRRSQAGDRYQELIYTRRRSAGSFLSRLRQSGPGAVDPRRVPYYLLLVGNPDEIPHGFQFGLDVQHAVGRLSFPRAADYAAYAEGVVRHESLPPVAPSVAIFSPEHECDLATEACVEQLTRPLLGVLKKERPQVVRISAVSRDATRARLRSIVADDRCRLVFTAGHATCYAHDDPLLPNLQGSLVCSDWPGPRSGSVELDQAFGANDVPPEVDLTGRIFFNFGCYTAGTPRRDSFDTSDPSERKVLTPEPFVARLPQRLLSQPAGSALAVIGHVDRAWPAAFSWDGYGQIDVFEDAIKAMVDGVPVGMALESFRQRYTDLAVRMSGATLRPGDADIDRPSPTELWVTYNDARSYVLLGDPAVRLHHGG